MDLQHWIAQKILQGNKDRYCNLLNKNGIKGGAVGVKPKYNALVHYPTNGLIQKQQQNMLKITQQLHYNR